jgi:hypothetical protein
MAWPVHKRLQYLGICRAWAKNTRLFRQAKPDQTTLKNLKITHLQLATALLSVATCTTLQAAPISQKPAQNSSISLTQMPNAELLLEIRQAPLAKVLKEISTKTGVRIHYSVLPEVPITATCGGATARQLMDCLVAKQLGLIVHDDQQNKPAEFWLLGSSVGHCQAVAIGDSKNISKTVSAELTPKQQAMLAQIQQEQSDRLLKQAQAKNPEQRAAALANLGSVGLKDDLAVDDALQNALHDPNAEVRAQAISSVLKRGGAGIEKHVEQALNDKSAAVRLATVSAISDDVGVLQKALNDTDEAVRNLAKDKLDDLAAKQAKAQ